MSFLALSRSVAVLLIFTVSHGVLAQQERDTRESLLHWVPMNYFSPYAAVPATDGGSIIHAFTQKLVPMQDSVDATSSDLGYGYYRLQQQAMFYQKRLAQLNVALHNRVLSAYEHLLPS